MKMNYYKNTDGEKQQYHALRKKDWTDQPDELVGVKRIARFTIMAVQGIGALTACVYKQKCSYYLTIGNLFGSETIKTDDLEKVFFLVSRASYGFTSMRLPPGCEKLENSE